MCAPAARAKPAPGRRLPPAPPFLLCRRPGPSLLGQRCLFKRRVLGFFSLLARFTPSGFTCGKAKHFRVSWGGGPGRSKGRWEGRRTLGRPCQGPAGGPGSCSVVVRVPLTRARPPAFCLPGGCPAVEVGRRRPPAPSPRGVSERPCGWRLAPRTLVTTPVGRGACGRPRALLARLHRRSIRPCAPQETCFSGLSNWKRETQHSSPQKQLTPLSCYMRKWIFIMWKSCFNLEGILVFQ